MFSLESRSDSRIPPAANAAFFSSEKRQSMLSPAITAIIIGVVAALAFGGGFAIADWRKSGELERARSESKLLTASNNKCAEDVHNVNTAVQEMLNTAIDRERKAAQAVKEAEPVIEKRKAAITRIRALPAVRLDMQCEAITQEQIIYVQARHSEAQ
jgi:hypothetical protein